MMKEKDAYKYFGIHCSLFDIRYFLFIIQYETHYSLLCQFN
jgi:hypothetical protein